MKTNQINWPASILDDQLPLGREYDPTQIINSVYSVISRTIESTNVEIKAVAVTSMRQAITMLDRDNHEIYIGPNIDLRAIFEGSEIDSKHKEEIYKTTGRLPSFLFANAKLEWIKRHSPDKYHKIAKVITLGDWIIWSLTGEIISETTIAGEAGLLNISTKTWATELSELLDLPIDDTVPLLNIGEFAGKVTKSVSKKTNLPIGTTVTSAGADTQCGSLGIGATNPNDVAIISGWSSPIQWVTKTPIISKDASSWFGCHALQAYWVTELTAGDTGHSYNWLAKTLRQNFTHLDNMASEVVPGAEGTSMFLAKEQINMSEIGITTGGILFPTPITMNERGDGHLARAALESISYTIKARLSQIESIVGRKPKDVYLAGGMAKSDTFIQIITDVLNREIYVGNTHNSNAIGGFIAGITAINEQSSLAEASIQNKRNLNLRSPKPLTALEYQGLYDEWKVMSAKLNSINN
ncbi:MAG: Sugar (pentulose or hexulose) kinase [Chloroflexi bacterium]|nr:MAG: Sugar (pentulose or hexulose) kinase [Chloroflexota bacterium]